MTMGVNATRVLLSARWLKMGLGVVAFQLPVLHGQRSKTQADNRQRLLRNDEMNVVPDLYLVLMQTLASRYSSSQIGVHYVIGNKTASSNLHDPVLTTNVSADSFRTTKGLSNGPTWGYHRPALGLAALLLDFNGARQEVVSVLFSEVTASATAAIVLLCVFIIVAGLFWWFSMGEEPTRYRRQYSPFPREQLFLNETRVVHEDPSFRHVAATRPPSRETRSTQQRKGIPSSTSSHHLGSPFSSPTPRPRGWNPVLTPTMPLSSSSHPPSPRTAVQLPHATAALKGPLCALNAVLCPSFVVGHTETWFSIPIPEMVNGSESFNIMGLSKNAVLCCQWVRTSAPKQVALSISSNFPALATATQIVETSQQDYRPLFEMRSSENQLFGIMKRRNGGQLVLQKNDKLVLSIDVDPGSNDLTVIGEAGPVAVISRNMAEGCETLDVHIGACVDCILILCCVVGMACLS